MFTRAFFAVATILATSLTAPVCLAQSVAYEKYTLGNGLTVILHEDHTLPVATVNLWYRVGAKEEQAGRSGFAHLFEHLMFMGTQRVPGGEFDNLMEQGGGANNASTSLDRTNYFSSGPATLLPTLLWLDADRMEDLGSAMTTEKLNLQRDVVRNEIRQNVENTPYGSAEEAVYRLMYPKGHPYHEAVYGTHADLEAADVHNVKDFFATFYVPNNCSLVVAGDFDSAQIKPLIESLYGSVPRGGPVVQRQPSEWPVPVLGKVVRATLLDKVELPRISFTYHSPAQYAEGDAEMDLLASVLSQGKSSRLYKRLVLEEKLASDVIAFQNSATLGSMFQIYVDCVPGTDLNAVEGIVDAEIAKLIAEGIAEGELAQRKSRTELAMLSLLDTLAGKADKLNEYEYFFGEPNSFKRDLDRYRNATPAGVQGWAKKVLTPGSRVIMRTLPEQPERVATGRDTPPGPATPGEFVPKAPDRITLSNGVPVLVFTRPEIPLIAMEIVLTSGGPLAGPDKAGLGAMMASMLDEGTGDLNAVGFADAVQTLGATFSSGARIEAMSAGLTVLKRNFEPAAMLFANAVTEPTLGEEDFERVKRLHLSDLEQSLNDPQAVAENVGLRVLFGQGHPYARPAGGVIESAKGVTLTDVRALHAWVVSPEHATIIVSGDITAQEAKGVLEKAFAGFRIAARQSPTTIATPEPPSTQGLRVVLVDRPDAPQTVIRLVLPGPRVGDAGRPAYRALNTILGGSFTSRLNQNLREKNGYTYGARSRFVMEPSAGMFIARTAVKADVTGLALKEFIAEVNRIRTGDITAVEAAKATQTVRTETIEGLAGIGGPIATATPLVEAGIGYVAVQADLSATMELDAGALNALAKKAFPLDAGVLVLVGDKGLILKQIEGLGLPKPVELSAEGESIEPTK